MRPITRRTTTLLAAATLAVGLAACADDDPTVDDTSETEDTAPDTADDADDADEVEEVEDADEPDEADEAAGDADGETVVMTFFNFEPDDVTVPVGTTVTWVNEDPVRHTATADDGSFDVDTPAEGDEGSHTFDEAGEFTYVCEVHASMTATITVG